MLLPIDVGGCGGDCDTALAFLRHVVHLRGAVIDAANLVGFAREIEYPLSDCRFARVDVRDDPDVAKQRQVAVGLHRLRGVFPLSHFS